MPEMAQKMRFLTSRAWCAAGTYIYYTHNYNVYFIALSYHYSLRRPNIQT
eukprot:COSAG06_NODE_40887_length_397_cov_1.043624_1_plen_49_part_01